jgi:hypothetical protein
MLKRDDKVLRRNKGTNMKSIIIILTFGLILSSAFARKPAVEDFVGVESESYEMTSPGSEVLFNFDNTITSTANETSGSTIFTYMFIASFLALPFMMWFGLTRSQKALNSTIKSTVSVTSYTKNSNTDNEMNENVEYLSDYKKNEKKAS